MTNATPGVSDLMTADQLAAVDIPGKTTELIRGQLIVRELPGTYHGHVAARLLYLLGAHVYPARLGALYAQDTGFKLRSNPDTVRAPDAAFIAADRVVHRWRGYAAIAPDLVAEIVSPGDRVGELLAKVADWLDAGVRVVWVIDPERNEGQIYRPNGSVAVVGVTEELTAEEVLTGLRLALAELLT